MVIAKSIRHATTCQLQLIVRQCTPKESNQRATDKVIKAYHCLDKSFRIGEEEIIRRSISFVYERRRWSLFTQTSGLNWSSSKAAWGSHSSHRHEPDQQNSAQWCFWGYWSGMDRGCNEKRNFLAVDKARTEWVHGYFVLVLSIKVESTCIWTCKWCLCSNQTKQPESK